MFFLYFFFFGNQRQLKKLESGATHKLEMYAMIKDVTLIAFPPPHLPNNPRTSSLLGWDRTFEMEPEFSEVSPAKYKC